MNTKKWTMRDGTKIRIKDMGDGHLVNTIRMLKRYGALVKRHTEMIYLCGPTPQGDMAEYAFNQEFDRVMDADPEEFAPDILEDLCAEADRRGLTY